MQIKYTEDFEKWLKNLKDTVAKGIINRRLKRLSEGNAGDVAPVGDGVSELRIHFGCGAGKKGSQTQDILKAKEVKKCLTKQLLN